MVSHQLATTAGCRRVLMISPHFPPDSSAGVHRVRLLAPHLRRYGWEPTVVAVDPRYYPGRPDHGLAELIPKHVRVVRCGAVPAWFTRWAGVGDLGLRSLFFLYRTCSKLLATESFDALFITICPSYHPLIGVPLKRKYGVPLLLDYQDPWVSEWGKTVGGGPGGTPDWKSRASRHLAVVMENRTLPAADAITAVSAGTLDRILERFPRLSALPRAVLPIGGEPADFERARSLAATNPWFDPRDGFFHICYVGTLLPLGFETLRALLSAVSLLRSRVPELYSRLRLHFLGTSNQMTDVAAARVLPVARQLGVSECVCEIPPRIDYLEALSVLTQSSAILLLGSSEPHYTASKLYPALLARRPILALYHEQSSVAKILIDLGRFPSIRLVTYNENRRAGSQLATIFAELRRLMVSDTCIDSIRGPDISAFHEYTAEFLAGDLACVLDDVAPRRAMDSGPHWADRKRQAVGSA